MVKKSLLNRLRDSIVIGDGGYAFALEKRGYVKAGPWTPECVLEHPDAVLQIHKEFLLAGSDVVQTFSSSEDMLNNRGCKAGCVEKINKAAANLVIRAASEIEGPYAPLTAGSISQCASYLNGDGKEKVQSEFIKQLNQFHDLDFFICENFEHIEEMEWAIQTCNEIIAQEVKDGLPQKAICSSMCIGPEGDLHGVNVGDCAIRMAKAGANVVGVNCHFDPSMSLDAMQMMRDSLDDENLLHKGSSQNNSNKVYLMCQPVAFHTPEATRQGIIDLPEYPLALEPRTCTRWDIHEYARNAFKLGIRYIGGCCGFEPYHIRVISETLKNECPITLGSSDLRMHTKPWIRVRSSDNYWKEIEPSTGRPYSSALSQPDEWMITQGHVLLKQQTTETTKEEMKEIFKFIDEGFE